MNVFLILSSLNYYLISLISNSQFKMKQFRIWLYLYRITTPENTKFIDNRIMPNIKKWKYKPITGFYLVINCIGSKNENFHSISLSKQH